MRILAILSVFLLAACQLPSMSTEETPTADDAMMEEEKMKKDDSMMEKEKENEMMKEDEAMEEDEMMEDDEAMEEEDEMMKEDEAMEEDEMMEDDEAMEEEDEMMEEEASGGLYVESSYEDSSVASAVIGNGEPALLFFYASWCGYCQTKDAVLQDLYQEGMAVSTYKIDFDTANDLKAQYGVATQDTVVLIDGEGNAVQTKLGATKADLRSMLSAS